MCVRFGVFWGILSFLARLGVSGALLAALGVLLGALGPLLGQSWPLLAHSWRLLAAPRAILEALGDSGGDFLVLKRLRYPSWASWALIAIV